MLALTLVVAYFLAHPGLMRLPPYVIAPSDGPVIATFGPLGGGSVDPARRFGPAVFSGGTTDLAIQLVAPLLGAVLGAVVHHLLVRRLCAARCQCPSTASS